MRIKETKGYRFPRVMSLCEKEATADELFSKLWEEVLEFEETFEKYNREVEDSRSYYTHASSASQASRKDMLMELMDVMHVCETIMYHYGVSSEEAVDAATAVFLKNKLRGYYGSYNE